MLAVIICCITFSSCFETVEEINLNADGSGRMILTLNVSQSKAKVASLMKLKTVNGHKIPSQQEIVAELNQTAIALRATPGISNVKTTSDFSNYIITVSFDFKEVANINAASGKIMQQYKVPTYNFATYSYNKSTKTFAKSYQLNAETKKQFQQMKAEDKEVFKNALYTSVYRFATPVKSLSNKEAKISGSQKSVMFRTAITNIFNYGTSINNAINLQ
ncbi:hypothetical protein DBR32_09820 [Taibaiella sp. KBW10]|uniref:hypothetical protein n=1 Tax=Taibaiella sp. KBW10 TaxID=2153357 RepID=UPI000F5A894D|nr:hypothetical protein [Taibaiella sp. KBW10]RQO30995.1 hypothetical protein DBR32_09820 [Taibaiella sp. KBW10]